MSKTTGTKIIEALKMLKEGIEEFKAMKCESDDEAQRMFTKEEFEEISKLVKDKDIQAFSVGFTLLGFASSVADSYKIFRERQNARKNRKERANDKEGI